MLLRDKDKTSLLNIFNKISYQMEVWAYGSRVTGEAHDGSDLDLVIRSKNLEKIPLNIFLELKNRIKHSNIPIVVDLFDWARLPQNFHQQIEKNHEVLFQNLEK